MNRQTSILDHAERLANQETHIVYRLDKFPVPGGVYWYLSPLPCSFEEGEEFSPDLGEDGAWLRGEDTQTLYFYSLTVGGWLAEDLNERESRRMRAAQEQATKDQIAKVLAMQGGKQ